MKPPPIIEVTEDEEGWLSYRLRTSLLNTQQYGQLLIHLAALISKMMAVEGNFDQRQIYAEILHYMAEEMESDEPAKLDVRMLQ